MPIVESAIESSNRTLELVAIEVDRHSLQKCRWRKCAQDGTDFAFSLREPLRDGDFVFETERSRYQVCQLPEAVLVVRLPGDPGAAARLAWAVGNLHQPIDVRQDCLLVGDDPAMKRLLASLSFAWETSVEIFSPPASSFLNHHTHDPGLEYDHEHFIFGHSSSSPF